MNLGVRWTIGDVSEHGFRALALSIRGAYGMFGQQAEYTVCVNSVLLASARRVTGGLPVEVRWRQVDSEVPAWIRNYIDGGFAEGVAWKFAPPRVFPNRHELSLDNDVILWRIPEAIATWLEQPHDFLIAEDVVAMFGAFATCCGPLPRNAGIRGFPPGFDLESALRRLLERQGVRLTSELDEQGLNVAVAEISGRTQVVPTSDVTICSPFPPHVRQLGNCGAHFVGLNSKHIDWMLEGRHGHEHTRDNWSRFLPEVERHVEVLYGDRKKT